MKKNKLFLTIIFLIFTQLIIVSCAQTFVPNKKPLQLNKTAEIKQAFITASEKQNQIWAIKDENEVKRIINNIYYDESDKQEIFNSYKKALELDQGIEYIKSEYNIDIVDYTEDSATLKVSGTLQGYPISFKTGLRRKNSLDNFSYNSHIFNMKKLNGTWKIKQF